MTKILKLLLFAVFHQLLSTTRIEANKITLNLYEDYRLQYEVKNGIGTNAIIEFSLISNANGWMAIGINEFNASMLGSDIFMGGVNGTNNLYGSDYHVPLHPIPVRPYLDVWQNWNVTGGYRLPNGTATLNVIRFLNTTDLAEDTVIQNKEMYLLWAINRNTHNTSDDQYARAGILHLNLLEGTEGGVAIPPPPGGGGRLVVSAAVLVLGLLVSLCHFYNGFNI